MGTLYIVSTPIGNLEDISLRALRVLFTVPVILAEDTRRTGTLIDWYRKNDGIIKNLPTAEHGMLRLEKPRFIAFNEHTEQARLFEVIKLLEQGHDLALVSDAGTPLVSDPGFRLVRACIEKHIRIVPVPGATAWVTGLVASGLPMNYVLFVGFLPIRQKRRQKDLRKMKEALAGLTKSPTVVFYEAPHRLLTTLDDILTVLGNVEVTLAQELTKMYEKISSRPVSLWIAELKKLKAIKGEYTVMVQWKSEIADETIDVEE